VLRSHRLRAHPRRVLAAAAVAACAAACACAEEPSRPPDPARSYDVRILRDVWGVPHVFGDRDPDAAYGLAWAHAEDDFHTIQISLLAARGRLASVLGTDGAANDFLVHWLRIEETVAAGYPEDVAPPARALARAYADGLNAYAAHHPEEVLPGVLPFEAADVVRGFVHKNALFLLGDTARRLFDDELPIAEAARAEAAPAESGSNAIAVGPARSTDGRSTYLVVNSHQPWEGPVAWYEAHVHSDEGWDAVGGIFPGAPVILHGHNRHLGWAHTVNRPDLVDLYRLEIHPDDPNRYRFDGDWRELEVREVPIRVRLWGPLSWTFHRKALWSVHGPVVRRPDGAFAVRYAGMDEVGQLEQTWRMNRATTFAAWRAAMARGGIAMFNTVYADREGHVYYVYNARIPERAEGHDWSGVVPGDTSETLWTGYVPYDALPQVLDPTSGFVQNCNSTPFRTTTGPDNPRREDFPERMGVETRMTNRAHRALELLDADPAIDAAELAGIKWDRAYSPDSRVAGWVRSMLAAPAGDDPTLGAAQEHLATWDLRTDPANPAAALGVLAVMPLLEARREGRPAPDLLESLGEAARTLRRHHGRLDVPWHEVNRLRRGELDLGLGGGPDVLHAVYGELGEDGRLVGRAGDSYVMLVELGPEGVRSRSIHQYGSATRDPQSPHYADQAVLFAKRMTKPVWMDEDEIRRHLERAYRPGRLPGAAQSGQSE